MCVCIQYKLFLRKIILEFSFSGPGPVISEWPNDSWENNVPHPDPEQLHVFIYRA